jgi:hypothetical protein
VNVVLGAGAFVAFEKGDREVAAKLRLLQTRRVPLRTSSAVVAQIWRDRRKQALLARLMDGVRVRGLGPGDDKRTGELMAVSRTSDVIDAHLALLVEEEDQLWTSDPDDMERLLAARQVSANVVKT